MQDLTRSSQALQAMVMQVRMIPVEAVFLRFPRLVRDLSSKLGKKVELVLTGQDTELDRTVVDMLGDPLVHLVRNSLDHGLEMPDERRAAGKPETGVLEISARHAGGNVVITVRDDGRGIDPARVARKALERGLITADQVDEVDMDARDRAAVLGRFLDRRGDQRHLRPRRRHGRRSQRRSASSAAPSRSTSGLGTGTTAQIRLPLTLAIMSALLDRGQRHAARHPARARRADAEARRPGRPLGRRPADAGARRRRAPAARAGLGPRVPVRGARRHAVIVRGAEQRLALAVSRLVGQRELVTRPLPSEVGDGLALSGGAVLSDGSIALIVDCDALAEQSRTFPVTTNGRAGSPPTLAHAA